MSHTLRNSLNILDIRCGCVYIGTVIRNIIQSISTFDRRLLVKKLMLVVVAMMVVGSLGVGQELGLKGVGGSIGFVSISPASSTESFSGFAIAAHAYLGDIAKDLGLFPEIEYFSTSKDVSGVTLKVSDFAINANLHYNIAMEGQVKPYVGAGLGFNSMSYTFNLPFLGTVSASDSRIGINLLAGANYKMNDEMSLFFEPRYVLSSDYNHLLIKVGATFAMK